MSFPLKAALFVQLFLVAIYGFRLLTAQSDVSDTFRDDFNRMSLNSGEWRVYHKPSDVENELQYYTQDAVFVRGGRLHIQTECRPITVISNFIQKFNYTSGRLTSTRHFKYGQFEWRAKMPKGSMLQSSIELFNPFWDDGIKIAQISGSSPQTIKSNIQVFRMGESPTTAVHHDTGLDLSNTYHYYRLSWTEDCVVIYFNDIEIVRVSDPTTIPQSIMKIGMNVAFSADSPNSTMDSAEFLVDYLEVRPPVMGMCNGPSNATWPFSTSTTITTSPRTIDWVAPSFNYNFFPYARFPIKNFTSRSRTTTTATTATTTTTTSTTTIPSVPNVSPLKLYNLAPVCGTAGVIGFLIGLAVAFCVKRGRVQRQKARIQSLECCVKNEKQIIAVSSLSSSLALGKSLPLHFILQSPRPSTIGLVS